MKKIISILFLLCFALSLYGQKQSYRGFYQTRFFNVFGEVKVIEAEFEVQENSAIVGKLKLGNDTKILQGQVESNGKFEVRTSSENGVVTLIKGQFPVTKNEGKVSLIQRTEQKGKGSRSISETGISGFIKQITPPAELKDVGITDDGKTLLWFQHSNPLFGKEWSDYPATVKKNGGVPQTAFEVEMKLDTPETERRFRFRIVVRDTGQKVWLGKDLSISSYGETKKSADGKEAINFFMGSTGNVLGGQVEIVSENDKEVVFKITNLRIKNVINDNYVQIDGYIHAVKTQ